MIDLYVVTLQKGFISLRMAFLSISKHCMALWHELFPQRGKSRFCDVAMCDSLPAL
jgi:hypothetical protein